MKDQYVLYTVLTNDGDREYYEKYTYPLVCGEPEITKDEWSNRMIDEWITEEAGNYIENGVVFMEDGEISKQVWDVQFISRGQFYMLQELGIG